MADPRTELIEAIKFELGGSVLRLEIDDDGFGKALDKSLRELGSHINIKLYKSVELDSNGMADIPVGWKVRSILNIYPTKLSEGSSATVGDSINDYNPFVPFSKAFAWAPYSPGMYDRQILQQISIVGSMMGDRSDKIISDYIYYKSTNKLFVDTKVKVVTIEYTSYDVSLDVILEGSYSYWYNKLYYLFLANAKIVIGRIRSKFTVGSSPTSLDGERILEEGLEEHKTLIEDLITGSDTYRPM